MKRLFRLEEPALSAIRELFTIFLLAIFGVLILNAGMTSQTREPRIRAQQAPEDGKNMQANLAFALSIMALTLGFHPQAHAATPAAITAQAAPASAATKASAQPQAHFTADTESEKLIETGKATWYGLHHSHRYTVSGERFDPRQLTAAHRNLPIGTVVRVTDRDTGRSVVVRVNDREPPHGIRCIDLSEGAAQALGIRRQGVANVTITEVLPSDAVEVAEAPEDAAPRSAALSHAASVQHGLRHKRHAAP